MSGFDVENVEWRDGGRGPRNLKELWDLEADCYPEDLDLIPASAYRKAVEEIGRLEKGREVERAMLRGAMSRIKELEAECREWKEQCEKGDAKLVRECEEWREQCEKMAQAINAKLIEDYRGNPPNEPGLKSALSNYLKVKESHERG